jgi:hypothetical protein
MKHTYSQKQNEHALIYDTYIMHLHSNTEDRIFLPGQVVPPQITIIWPYIIFTISMYALCSEST